MFSIHIIDDYFRDIIEFLTTGTAPVEYSTKPNQKLVVKAANFTIIVGKLYKLGLDEILRRYVLHHERPLILLEGHDGIVGGHYSGNPTTQKLLTT